LHRFPKKACFWFDAKRAENQSKRFVWGGENRVFSVHSNLCRAARHAGSEWCLIQRLNLVSRYWVVVTVGDQRGPLGDEQDLSGCLQIATSDFDASPSLKCVDGRIVEYNFRDPDSSCWLGLFLVYNRMYEDDMYRWCFAAKQGRWTCKTTFPCSKFACSAAAISSADAQ